MRNAFQCWKIVDETALLKSDYWNNWRNLEKLSFYTEIEKSKLTNTQEDQTCKAIGGEYNVV